MITLKSEHPFVDAFGKSNNNLIKYYAEDDKGVRYKIKNVQTGNVLEEAVALYPCKYSYAIVKEKCAKQPNIIVEDKPKRKSKAIEDSAPLDDVAEEVENTEIKDEEGENENELYKED